MSNMDICVTEGAHALAESCPSRVLGRVKLVRLEGHQTEITTTGVDQRQCHFAVHVSEAGVQKEGAFPIDAESRCWRARRRRCRQGVVDAQSAAVVEAPLPTRDESLHVLLHVIEAPR